MEKKIEKLHQALRDVVYHEGKGKFIGFGKCSQSDINILWDWLTQLETKGYIESIKFEEPFKILKKYGLEKLLID